MAAKLTWAIVVPLVWLFSEVFTFFALGWPIEWWEAHSVIGTVVVAVLTFPADAVKETKRQSDEP